MICRGMAEHLRGAAGGSAEVLGSAAGGASEDLRDAAGGMLKTCAAHDPRGTSRF